MFNKTLENRITKIEERIAKIEHNQYDFLCKAHDVLATVLEHDKRKFMYELQQEDIELIAEGKKVKAIRKIIN
jgi:hypothetical protein